MSSQPSVALERLSAAPTTVPAEALKAPSAAPRRLFDLCEYGPAGRAVLEAFIAERYAQAYGAQLRHFLPRLFGLHSVQSELLAAFGLREAAAESLFLEHYLDQPIEQVAARVAGESVRRDELVEVGNLAGRHPGALRLLIPLLAEKLAADGYRWLAFTGSPRLINGFARLGVQLRPLAPATVHSLPPQERGDWGAYYDAAPMVMLGDIQAGRRHLDRHPHILQSLAETGAALAGVRA